MSAAAKAAKASAKSSQAAKILRGLRYPWPEAPEFGALQEITPGLFWLRMPLPFDLNHINLWLAEDGDGWTVIDTGAATAEAKSIWRRVMAETGNKPVPRAIVTHLHPDHVGLAGWFARKYGAELWMSRTDYLMCRMLAADTGRDAPKEALDFYRAAGFDDEMLAAYEERFGGFGMLISRLPDGFRRLREGETIVIGNGAWRTVTGRGHAPEHICLYNEAEKIFIAGDQVLPRITSNVSVFPTEPQADPLGDWLESCRHLQSVIPDDVLVCPAHNEPFYGLHTRLQALIDGHKQSLTRLEEFCSEPRRAMDVYPVLFRRRVNRGIHINMMAVGESIAHLNHLIGSGRASVERDKDGVSWYRNTQ